jgi:Ca2+-binding RTX toxin-like protein
VSRRGSALTLALLVALAVPGSASARVALVATGTPDLAFLDVSSNAISAHLALPGPSRAVAITRDGQRGFVTAGAEVVAVDVNARTEVARSALAAGAVPIPVPGAVPGAVPAPAAEISDIALSPDGTALYVVQGRRLATLDPVTLGLRAEVGLNGDGTRLAIDEGGRTAAVVLANGRVAIVSLARNVLLRHVKLPGAIGVAIDRGGRTLVSAGGRLRTIEPGQRRARKQGLKLPDGAGGGLALSAGGSRLAVGAAPGGAAGALVDLRRGTALRTVAGRGPGWPAWNLDSSRILVADSGAATITLVSPFSRGRVATVGLAGTVPLDLVVQPGIATFIGTDGPDTLTGTRGADTIQGLGGNDVLRGGRDRDLLDGGAGDDVLSGGSSSDELTGGEGNDALAGGAGNDKLLGSGGDDSANGGTGNDEIQGELGNDALDGGDGDDTIYGGDGNDSIIEKGFGDDKILDGGPGDDVIRGGRGSDKRMFGGDGNDQLYGESGQERILGGNGNDLIDGGRAGDRLEGEAGDDQIIGDAGPDGLYGGPGNDQADGGASADRVEGNEGDDMLVGGSAPDILDGGPGDDSIRAADDSADSVYCGPGNDTVFVESTAPTEDVLFDCETVVQIAPEPDTGGVIPNTIRGTPQRDVLNGSNGIDSIFGQGGDDKLIAKGGDDYVDGENGNDVLFGGSGDDVMAGRRGNDVIHGGDGDDRITGDRGRDAIFGDAGNDTINGNFDADRIEGGAGDDRINVVHGGHDLVRCGPGKDVVFADAADAVSKDCESVRR